MTVELPIEKGMNITIVNDLGAATQYEVIYASLEVSERYEMLRLCFLDRNTHSQKTISLYADQIEVFNTETEELIDLYA